MDFYYMAPELSLLGLAIAVILLDLAVGKKELVAAVSAIGLIVPLAFTVSLWGTEGTTFNGMLIVDNFSLFFKLIFIGITALVIMSSWQYVSAKIERFRGEFYSLLLLSALGLMLMAASRDMIAIYVALEVSSMSLYALVAFLKDRKSTEAGIKYLLLGAVASATLLYGMVLIFGLTGTTDLVAIQNAITLGDINEPGLYMGLALIAAGFCFKIAAVPFHMWAPDVYQGAPTPITAYLSVASKAAGFAVIMRIFFNAFGSPMWLHDDWSLLFAVLAAITMTVGNVIALWQTNIKRLLAYSGVAQAGYLMVGLAAANSLGQSGIMFFLAVYSLANLGAFICVIAITNKIGSDELSDFAGIAKRAPVIAFMFAICLISLTGIPPTAGFMGKLFVFQAAMDEGMLWLVIIAVLNSVIAAFYYFKVIKAVFVGESISQESVPSSFFLRLSILVCIAGVLALGIYPSWLLKFADVATALVP